MIETGIEIEIEGSLLLRYVNETAGAEERRQVELWLAKDSANIDTLAQIARICHAQRTLRRIQQRDPHKALENVHRRMKRNGRRGAIRRWAVAASLIIGLAGIGLTASQFGQFGAKPHMITMNTNAGMRSQLTLPDGTIVHLNAGSTLVYPSKYGRKERRVRLEGEGYFKVAHDAGHPFVVSTADDRVNVRVLGTEFNLQAYQKDGIVQTTLVEGSVELGVRGDEKKVLLKPSNKATYDMTTGKVFLERVNTEQVTSWIEGRFIFKDTPVPEVLRQLAHFYSVDFDIHDEVIRGYTFTGVFENASLFQILDYLKISSKIDYATLNTENQRMIDSTIRIYKK